MPSTESSWILAAPFALALGAAALLAAACGPPPVSAPPDGSASTAPSEGEPPASPTNVASSPPMTSVTSHASGAPTTLPVCALPAPLKSQDTCKSDADCGVSDPCHAHACVAKAKSHPPDKSTMCTQMMDCSSADANPCACFEGVCALVPPAR